MDRKRKEFIVQSDDLETKLKAQIVGLVHKNEYKSIRENAEKNQESHEESKSKPLKNVKQTRLSFFDEEEPIITKKAMKTNTAEVLNEAKDFSSLQTLVDIKYAFWNTNEISVVKIPQNSTIEQFLDSIRKDIKELKGVSLENTLCVKDDLILPQHLSFYDLRLVKGKYGLLFEQFDSSPSDSILCASEITRIVRIADRKWFEKHKHMHPANKWKPLDLNKVHLE